MTRTFIALELDESLQRYLDEIIRQVAQQLPGLRWVDPVGIHLTLAFLGELTDEQLDAATQAAQQAAGKLLLLIIASHSLASSAPRANLVSSGSVSMSLPASCCNCIAYLIRSLNSEILPLISVHSRHTLPYRASKPRSPWKNNNVCSVCLPNRIGVRPHPAITFII